MAASINFYAGENFLIYHLSNSGLGFYGTAFGASVQVGEYQGRTYITNSNGTAQGPEADNVKYSHPNSGILGQTGSGLNLLNIPNYQSTLNIRATFDTAVKTQNAEFRIYDRSNINNPASGVTCKVAEIIHPSVLQSVNGSGDTAWITAAGSGVPVPLVASPGVSGERQAGANTSATQHDWYLAISASPDSVGSKTLFGGYVSLEYY